MAETYIKTKASFLEAGLPCASLSAECQRDNNARQRPPQNRLHIWWARRPPTICRAAVLAGLLPFDLRIHDGLLPEKADEPSEDDLKELPSKYEPHIHFFKRLISEVEATRISTHHDSFIRALGIAGDADRAYRRMALREEYLIGSTPIMLPMDWTYRHEAAFRVTPGEDLIKALIESAKELLNLPQDEPLVLMDQMAGGGAIPLEGIRYGLKTYANDLNPVAGLTLKATLEYPSKFGLPLSLKTQEYAKRVDKSVRERLLPFFYIEPPEVWWREEGNRAVKEFGAKSIVNREPSSLESSKNCTLWLRQVPCPDCGLNIPLSTNLHIVQKKGKPEASLAAFPEVPSRAQGDTCAFRIVGRSEWKDCKWPKPGFEKWHPRNIPTFKGGNAYCPRCGHQMDGNEVKAFARSQPGGLPSQMYAVASKVPVKLTYKNGDIKVRYMWRFRAPTDADLKAAEAAKEELNRLLPKWEAQDLVPNEEVPEDMEDKRPREYGMPRWRDLFLPRQLLTNMVVLEEIRKAQEQARDELTSDEAEAVGVYLAFILSKVVNYNSVNTFWHYGRQTVAQTFSRHDFAFRPSFCEFEGARETVLWGASQVIDAYEELAGLIHGHPVEPKDSEDDETESVDKPERTKSLNPEETGIRSQVIVPTVTCEDAAALTTPEPGTVHLICVDPPYYNNVQYSELSNFFYVWLKRALKDFPGLAHLFREPLAENNREAVANAARWKQAAETETEKWQARYEETFSELRSRKIKVKEAKERALETVGPKPLTAKERADRFYEDKMSQIFRRARQLLHPAGRMVVMFNHKQTWAWRSLGMALIRAGFEIRSSVPIHTEAESSLNIRGLDAARSTVLLLCLPREEAEQSVGNWASVQNRVSKVAQNAAAHFYEQGLRGTDLYLSSLGPALGEVAKSWPVTDFAGREVDLADALEQAYRSVGHWRLEALFKELTEKAELMGESMAFTAEGVDRDTQTLWLWLDTFAGEIAGSDDLQKLVKSLNVDPADFKKMGLVASEKDIYVLRAPQEVDLRKLSRGLQGQAVGRGRSARAADAWEERTFPGFTGGAVWNAIALMAGSESGPRGADAVKRWLRGSGYDVQKDFFGAYAVTLYLLEQVFLGRKQTDLWHETAIQARRAWDLVIKTHRM